MDDKLKDLHEHHISVLGYNSITEWTLQHLLLYYTKTYLPTWTPEDTPNAAIGKLLIHFKDEDEHLFASLVCLHHPIISKVIFTDDTRLNARKEIDLDKLDIVAIYHLLKNINIFPTYHSASDSGNEEPYCLGSNGSHSCCTYNKNGGEGNSCNTDVVESDLNFSTGNSTNQNAVTQESIPYFKYSCVHYEVRAAIEVILSAAYLGTEHSDLVWQQLENGTFVSKEFPACANWNQLWESLKKELEILLTYLKRSCYVDDHLLDGKVYELNELRLLKREKILVQYYEEISQQFARHPIKKNPEQYCFLEFELGMPQFNLPLEYLSLDGELMSALTSKVRKWVQTEINDSQRTLDEDVIEIQKRFFKFDQPQSSFDVMWFNITMTKSSKATNKTYDYFDNEESKQLWQKIAKEIKTSLKSDQNIDVKIFLESWDSEIVGVKMCILNPTVSNDSDFYAALILKESSNVFSKAFPESEIKTNICSTVANNLKICLAVRSPVSIQKQKKSLEKKAKEVAENYLSTTLAETKDKEEDKDDLDKKGIEVNKRTIEETSGKALKFDKYYADSIETKKGDERLKEVKKQSQIVALEIFHRTFPSNPGKLYHKLLFHKTEIDKMLDDKYINKDDYLLLFPGAQIKETLSEKFSFSLLFTLITNFGLLTESSTGWNVMPTYKDMTIEASLVRLHIHFQEFKKEGSLKNNMIVSIVNSLLDLGANKKHCTELYPDEVCEITDSTDKFVGSETQMQRITKEFGGENRKLVITGGPSLGKTELVKAYYQQSKYFFGGNVCWIDATSREKAEDSFLKIAKRLGFTEDDHQIQFDEIKEKVGTFHASHNVLYIFDGAPDEKTIQDLLTSYENAFVIVTSCNESWSDQFISISISKLDVENTTKFMNAKRISSKHYNSILDLANGHPLIFQQLISYIGVNPEEIVTTDLCSLKSERDMMISEDETINKNVATSIAIINAAVTKIVNAEQTKLPKQILNALAHLGERSISISELLEMISKNVQLTHLKKVIAMMEEHALVGLNRRIRSDETTVTIHRLVQKSWKRQLLGYDDTEQDIRTIVLKHEKPSKLDDGREDTLNQIHSIHQSGKGHVSKIVLTGSSSFVNENIVRHYYKRNKADFGEQIVWIDTSSTETLKESSIGMVESLGLSSKVKPKGDRDRKSGKKKNSDAEETPSSQVSKTKSPLGIMNDIHQYFSTKQYQPLYVFENVKDESSLEKYLPKSKSSFTIVTSTNEEWADSFKLIEVEKFTIDEIGHILQNRLSKDISSEEIQEIYDMVDGHPFLLMLFMNFVIKSSVAVGEFIDAYNQLCDELTARNSNLEGHSFRYFSFIHLILGEIGREIGNMELVTCLIQAIGKCNETTIHVPFFSAHLKLTHGEICMALRVFQKYHLINISENQLVKIPLVVHHVAKMKITEKEMEKMEMQFKQMEEITKQVTHSIFQDIFPTNPYKLHQKLLSHQNEIELLLENKEINHADYGLMLPKDNKTVFSNTFSFNLLFKLITKFGALKKQEEEWYERPKHEDSSMEASLVRLNMILKLYEKNGKLSSEIFASMLNALSDLSEKKGQYNNLLASMVHLIKPTGYFEGRIQEILNIEDEFTKESNKKKRLVITGDPSIGKSEIAKAYCQQFRHRYDGVVLWIDSTSRKTVEDSLWQFSNRFDLVLHDYRGNKKQLKDIVSAIHNILKSKNVLYVFDGAPDEKTIKEFLKDHRTHLTLVTSDNEDWSNSFKTLPIDRLSNESIKKILGATYLTKNQYKLIEELANGHPQIAQQILSYINIHSNEIDTYLTSVKEEKEVIMSTDEVVVEDIATILAIVNININKIANKHDTKLPKQILNALVFLQEKSISLEDLEKKIPGTIIMEKLKTVSIMMEKYALLKINDALKITINSAVQAAWKRKISGLNQIARDSYKSNSKHELQKVSSIAVEALREFFHLKFPENPEELYKALNQYRQEIKKLVLGKVLNTQQFRILLPGNTDSKRTDSKIFDTPLLYILLVNFCAIPEPVTTWRALPNFDDHSKQANIIRLNHWGKKARHEKSNDKRREEIKSSLIKVLVELGVDEKSITNRKGPKQFDISRPVCDFVGRKAELDDIHDYFQKNIEKKKKLVIHGSPGIGKSQTVKAYFELYEECFCSNVLWIQSGSKNSLVNSFRTIAEGLHLEIADRDGNIKNLDTIVNMVHTYFSEDKILYVFDNAKDEHTINKYIPQKKNAFVIVTSQCAVWTETEFHKVHLRKFPKPEMENFIEICINEDSVKGIAALTDFCEGNPSVLRKMLNIFKDSGMGINKYIQDVSCHPSKYLLGSMNSDYVYTLSVAGALKEFRDEEGHSLACEILEFISHMGEKEIFLDVLTSKFPDKKPIEIELAAEDLVNHSFISLENKNNEMILQIEPSIQEIVKLECKEQCTPILVEIIRKSRMVLQYMLSRIISSEPKELYKNLEKSKEGLIKECKLTTDELNILLPAVVPETHTHAFNLSLLIKLASFFIPKSTAMESNVGSLQDFNTKIINSINSVISLLEHFTQNRELFMTSITKGLDLSLSINKALYHIGTEEKDIGRILKKKTYKDLEPVQDFVGRKDIIQEIKRGVESSCGSAAVIVVGETGVGKTETIKKYYQIYQDDFDENMVWIDASNYDTLAQSFRDIARGINDTLAGDTIDFTSLEDIVISVHRYHSTKSVLYVFDNAKREHTLLSFLPSGDNASVIITSKYRNWVNEKFKKLELLPLSNEEGKELITSRIERNMPDENLDKLICLLGLPSVYNQACIVLKSGETTITSLLDQIRNELAQLIKSCDDVGEISPVAISVSKVLWRFLEKHEPVSIEVLQALSQQKKYTKYDDLVVKYFFNKKQSEFNKALEILVKCNFISKFTSYGKKMIKTSSLVRYIMGQQKFRLERDMLKETNLKKLGKIVSIAENVLRRYLHAKFPEDPKDLYKRLTQILKAQIENSKKNSKSSSKSSKEEDETKINRQELAVLFPNNSDETSSETYDLPLLFKLVSNFCGLNEPPNGWDKLPDANDNTEEANIVRIHIGRHHIEHCASVDGDRYTELSQSMFKPLLGLGVNASKFEDLLPVTEFGIFPPIRNFYGRKAEIENIHQIITSSTKDRVVLHAGPGIGKSETVRQYYQRYKEFFQRKVLWINSKSDYSLEQSFLEIAEAYSLSMRDATGKLVDSQTVIIENVHQYFAEKQFLYIFDDARNMEQVERFLPELTKTHTIITSQSNVWSGEFRMISLEMFSDDDVFEFVSKNLAKDISEDQLKQIVTLSGGHPLALQQILSFLKTTKSGIGQYFSLLQSQILQKKANIDGEGLSVFTVIMMAVNRIQNDYYRNAHALLNILAHLDGQPIMIKFLEEILPDIKTMEQELQTLKCYSLIKIDESGENVFVTIHSLVQKAIIKSQKRDNEYRRNLGVIIEVVLEDDDDAARDWHNELKHDWFKHCIHLLDVKDVLQLIFENYLEMFVSCEDIFLRKGKIGYDYFYKGIAYCREHVKLIKNSNTNVIYHQLTGVLARCLESMGRLEEAEVMYEEVLQYRKEAFGTKHHRTLTTVNNLALCLKSMGRLEEAEVMYKDVLKSQKELSGKSHTSTLTTANNLALCLNEMGRFKAAEDLYKEILFVQRYMLGQNHPTTLTTANNLAICLNKMGKFQEAEEKYKDVLNKQKDQLGDSHPSTLTTIGNLAVCLHEMGRFKEAEVRYREVFNKEKEILGQNHPSSLTTANNLAACLTDMGACADAEVMYKEIFQHQKRILGDKHPNTLNTTNNLAKCLMEVGRFKEAEGLCTDLFNSQKDILGEDHPSTLTTANNLALCVDKMGKFEIAEIMYKENYNKQKNLQGQSHPSTLIAGNNFALFLQNKGRFMEAESLLKEVLEKQNNVLGPDHPTTLTTVNNLATCLYRYLGKFGEAEVMLREALNKHKEKLGENHPHTLEIEGNLAECCKNMGKFEDFEQIYKELINKEKDIFGDDHPHTLRTIVSFCVQLNDLDKSEQAKRTLETVLDKQQNILGPNHFSTLETAGKLALCLKGMGRLEESEVLYRYVLSSQRELFGENHSCTLNTESYLGLCLNAMGRFDEAEVLYKRVHDVEERLLGQSHSSTLASAINLAKCWKSLGRIEDAAAMFREVFKKQKITIGQFNPFTLITSHNLAACLKRMGRFEEAESMYRVVLNKRREIFGQSHSITLTTTNDLALCLNELGKFEEAEVMYKELLKEQKSKLGQHHPHTLVTVNNLASCLIDMNRLEEAKVMYIELFNIKKQLLGQSHRSTLVTANNLAGCLNEMGRHEEAEAMYKEIFTIRKNKLGESHPDTLETASKLAETLHSLGRFKEAVVLYKDVVSKMKSIAGPAHPITLTIANRLAESLKKLLNTKLSF